MSEEVEMNNISLLIREAKPLYFARKRRRNQLKVALAIFICAVGLSWFSPREAGYLYDFNDTEQEIYLTENGSVIEEMGLPVDADGFLKIV